MRRFFALLAGAHRTAPNPHAPYLDWHRWSVGHPAEFWGDLWRFANVIGSMNEPGEADVLVGGDRMAPPEPARGPAWFPGVRLNFAENLLRRRDSGDALVYRDESGATRRVSFRELHTRAGRVASALRAAGVQPGDRVAGYLPNVPEAVIAMLGASWIGATWSSCSPDFGVQGVLDRFGQIAPRVLVVADGYRYAAKSIDTLGRASMIVDALPSVVCTVVVPVLSNAPTGGATSAPSDPAALGGIRNAVSWDAWLNEAPAEVPDFLQLPFAHPLYVMYSSGTTGLPKCLVHGAGGTLLQHLKEHLLHGDLRADERIFYFTTCGWMMWNWLVSALATGATVVLYDGAPLPPSSPAALWDLAADERVSVFGTSARFLSLSEKAGLVPSRTHALGALRAILSTGSPLAPASFDYVERDVKPGVQLASISGGTDIISCFALGNPLVPVWRGELQALGLGMAVDVYADNGAPLRGAPGELVCTRPFPSMPVAFWDDPGGRKYHEAYFAHFPGVWRHGDWAEFTEHGGLVIHGRSDATLNPGGVRIGTAEIYREVERVPEVLESVVIGEEVDDGESSDVRIVLFVRLRAGCELDDALTDMIRRRIREATSPHHVPKRILQVRDIPRTISGKITEIAVRDAFHGRPVRNTAAMANPEALEEFRLLGGR